MAKGHRSLPAWVATLSGEVAQVSFGQPPASSWPIGYGWLAGISSRVVVQEWLTLARFNPLPVCHRENHIGANVAREIPGCQWLLPIFAFSLPASHLRGIQQPSPLHVVQSARIRGYPPASDRRYAGGGGGPAIFLAATYVGSIVNVGVLCGADSGCSTDPGWSCVASAVPSVSSG